MITWITQISVCKQINKQLKLNDETYPTAYVSIITQKLAQSEYRIYLCNLKL